MASDDPPDNDPTPTIKMNRGRATTSTPFSASPWENPKSLVGSLLEKTTSRAMRTLSTNNNADYSPSSADDDAPSTDTDNDDEDVSMPNPTIQNVLDATIVRSSSILDNNGGSNNDEDNGNNNQVNNKNGSLQKEAKVESTAAPKQHKNKLTYIGNPSVTPTALAHSLWKSTILPYEDTVIDATCGNGKDCLALARMLFPNSISGDDDDDDDSSGPKPQLIGIDIQSRAVHNTDRSLLSSLPSDIYYNHISLLEQSHEHLMNVPSDASSVGLICYNLGYLPGAPPPSPSQHDQSSSDTNVSSNNQEKCQTQTQTTLNSITDASLLLRVGGLLSIMTYPASNAEESIVVEHFVEGLAMLTSRDGGGWRGYLEGIPDYDTEEDEGRVRMMVVQALERVVAEGERKQAW
eukprot:CAMPEP_0172329438 /NCGR_PEP_ID=MMETSP1058-20130122/60880_1 /TAXON_ID=83371 /ORGANISM="Detonula confervacea, Strain CCMP 353" /LENGTH=405 /DNA_ID=CAMNT_0013046609 /DNA_START=459 /DNA_END=1673 /DNA_ORIENTATION=-